MKKFLEWVVNKHPALLAMWMMATVANVVFLGMGAKHWIIFLALGCVIGSVYATYEQYKKTNRR